MKPYVSIVIPVYNVEPYLEKCLESVLAQDYQDFECILVDDGSTDNSGRICDEFAVSDPRFTVIHKSNGGPVSARKAGLQKASGRFIGCVDSDDWIEQDYYKNLVQMQKKYNADIVAGNHVRDIGQESYPVCNNIPAGIYNRQDILPNLIYSGSFFEFGMNPSLCTKLIRKDILDITQMSVNEDIVGEEDPAVLYPSVLEADKILITNLYGYHYVQRQGSISKSLYSNDSMRLKAVFDYIEKIFISKNVINELKFQMMQWKKYVFLEHHIQMFDEGKNNNSILSPYGGILPHSGIVIYGASALGQTIDRYIKSLDEAIAREVLWIDKAYENFQKQGLAINAPEDILKLNDEYDVVLLASVTENIVCSMKKYLLNLHVPEHKIRWLAEDFLNSENVI